MPTKNGLVSKLQNLTHYKWRKENEGLHWPLYKHPFILPYSACPIRPPVQQSHSWTILANTMEDIWCALTNNFQDINWYAS